MNHGLKFLLGTLGDAPKKFGDPERLIGVGFVYMCMSVFLSLKILFMPIVYLSFCLSVLF